MSPRFPSEEPAAGDRVVARAARSQYVALIHEGFTEAQALQIVGQMLMVALQAQIDRKKP